MNDKNLCIIPARGGSKRIPKKNIKLFLGKPIMAYSIEIAQKSRLFETIVVTTDDSNIAAIAEQYGAVVPFLRSSENSNDHATLAEGISETLSYYAGQFRYACCILPTAPLIQAEHLKKGLQILRNSEFDTVGPICEFNYPIQRALDLKETGEISFKNEEHRTTRTQDLKSYFHDAGQFYWMHCNTGLAGEHKGAFPISSRFVQDIDNISDWEEAEYKYQFLSSR